VLELSAFAFPPLRPRDVRAPAVTSLGCHSRRIRFRHPPDASIIYLRPTRALQLAHRYCKMLSRVPARCFASAAHGNNLVFLGAPGVGKGTFAGRIAKMLGVPAISTGDIMRAEIKAGSALGQRVKEFTTSGRLVPDEVVTAVVKERLSQPDAAKGYILVRDTRVDDNRRLRLALPCGVRATCVCPACSATLQDGYPRTVQQAKDLDSFQVSGVKKNRGVPLPSPLNTPPDDRAPHHHSATAAASTAAAAVRQPRHQHHAAGARADGEDACAAGVRRLRPRLQPRQHQRGWVRSVRQQQAVAVRCPARRRRASV
jgi:hypothetical protein